MLKSVILVLAILFASTGCCGTTEKRWPPCNHPEWKYLDRNVDHPFNSPNPEWNGIVPPSSTACGAGKCG